MTSKLLQPIKSGSLRSQVFQEIRTAIFSGKFRPGNPLRELQLARDLQVSQATVREALLRLENLGLVIRVENRETIVTQLSSQEIRERIAIRIPLESLAAIEASRRMTKSHFEVLNQRLRDISRVIDSNSYFETAQADLEFHRYIWEQSGNRMLHRMLDQLTAPLFAFISIMRSNTVENLKAAVRSHKPIVNALKEGAPELIQREIQHHINTSYGEFLHADAEELPVSASLSEAKSRQEHSGFPR